MEEHLFYKIPDSWHVLITDVDKSTMAVMDIKIIFIAVLLFFIAACGNKNKKEKAQTDQPVMEDVDELVKDSKQAKKITEHDKELAKKMFTE